MSRFKGISDSEGDQVSLWLRMSEVISDLCRLANAEPKDIASFTITPYTVEAAVYLTNEDGHKYLDPETDEPAMEVRDLRVDVRSMVFEVVE